MKSLPAIKRDGVACKRISSCYGAVILSTIYKTVVGSVRHGQIDGDGHVVVLTVEFQIGFHHHGNATIMVLVYAANGK